MNRKAFYHLLKRYVEGDCTEEEKKLVEQWYDLLDDEDGQYPDLHNGNIKEILQQLWPRIHDQTIATLTTTTTLPPPTPIRSQLTRWLAAAVVLMAAGLIAFWLLNKKGIRTTTGVQKALAGFIKTTNTTSITDTLHLPDGSTILLEPGATLQYSKFTGAKREVYLDGNAFFKVAKKPTCPFYVHSKNLVTQVLGTSFFVKNNPVSNTIEVAVRTGKVAVYEAGQETITKQRNEEADGVILKPNQKVIYNGDSHHFRTTLIEHPLPVVINNIEDTITALNFVFDETPIATVLAHLEQAYHIDMVLENETLANCLFSGDIKGQNLYDQLEIICESVQATYEIRGTRILIKGSGCNAAEGRK